MITKNGAKRTTNAVEEVQILNVYALEGWKILALKDDKNPIGEEWPYPGDDTARLARRHVQPEERRQELTQPV
jgi:hypothetical protein